MKNRVIIDFETRSKLDLRKVNPWIYATHPSTEIMCVAYKFEDNETEIIKRSLIEKEDNFTINLSFGNISYKVKRSEKETIVIFEDLYLLADNSEITFEAHNAFFERCLWTHIMVKRYGFPQIPLERWFCSAAKAAYQALPRALADVGKVLNLKNQKDSKGHRLMLKMCKPRKPTKHNKAIWHELPEDIEALENYCIQDVESEYELSELLPELPPFERKIWLLDQKINDRGLYCDIENVKKLIALLDRTKESYKKEIHKLTNGEVNSPNQVAATLTYLESIGYELPDLQKETVAEALNGLNKSSIKNNINSVDKKAKRILEIRQAASKSSVKKLNAITNLISTDNRLRGLFVYHGAKPGRWAGAGVQVHNLVRNTYKGEALDLAIESIDDSVDWLECLYGSVNQFASKLIRPMFISAPDKLLISADFNAIEARVLSWLAGDKKGIDLYLADKDAYVNIATKIFDKPESKITKDQRFVGKQCILGLGYGMGIDRFHSQCKQYGKEIPYSLADKAVRIYRSERKKIVRYWYDIETAAKNAIITNRLIEFRNLKFIMKNGNLYIRLPSGRFLCYQSAQIDENDSIIYNSINSVNYKWEKTHTWGGKLVENIDQGISRDILACAMLRLEAADFPVVLHVHDEIVAEVDPWDVHLEQYIKIMCQKPDWLKGCPIKADGWTGKRYRK